MVAGGGAGRATGLLAQTVGGSTGSAGAARGSPETRAAESSWSESAIPTIARCVEGVEATEPARGCDLVHDVAGWVAVAVGALQPPARRGSGQSGGESNTRGSGRADRVLREYARAADGSEQ